MHISISYFGSLSVLFCDFFRILCFHFVARYPVSRRQAGEVGSEEKNKNSKGELMNADVHLADSTTTI